LAVLDATEGDTVYLVCAGDGGIAILLPDWAVSIGATVKEECAK
jgi:hypothetical protein